MLTRNAVSAIDTAAEQLQQRGEYLEVVEGSPISLLARETYSPDTMTRLMKEYQNDGVPLAVNLQQELIDASSQKSSNEVVEHDVVLESTVDSVAESISTTMHVARNEIIPCAKHIHDRYSEIMGDMEIQSSQLVVVIPNVYHTIWSASQLAGLVERFENTPLNVYRFEATMPSIDGVELEKMVYTGIQSLDDLITDWLQDLPESKLVNCYNRFFVENAATVGRATTANHLTDENLDRNDLLLIYLIAQGFERHMPEGLEISLDRLRNMLARTREQAGRSVARELVRRESDQRNNILIYSVRTRDWDYGRGEQTIVYVNNDVYQRYLNENGTVESIYGAALLGASVNYQNLMDQHDKNEQFYHRQQGIHNQRVAAKIYSSKRDAIRFAITRYINQMQAEERPAPVDTMHQRLTEVVGRYQPKDLDEEMYAIRDIVAQVLYAHQPNALMMLRAMDTAGEENPQLSARECALFAAIDMLARWCAGQIYLQQT